MWTTILLMVGAIIVNALVAMACVAVLRLFGVHKPWPTVGQLLGVG